MALLGFSLLVVAHEFGHLIAAKRSGVRVNEFWIGMGPKLLSRQFGETEYCLCLLPIGGACVMEGENGEEEPLPGSFVRASRPRRFLVLIAGVTMNLIVGYLILLALTFQVQRVIVPRIDSFYDGVTYSGEGGLQVGDTLKSIDGYRVLLAGDVSRGLARGSADGKFDITVQRGGKTVRLHDLKMTPDVDLGDGRKGYGLLFAAQEMTLGLRIRYAAAVAVNDARMIWDSLAELVSGAVGVEMLSGPVGVTNVLAQTAQSSMPAFWELIAFISINLAVMNLLPLPALDGGRILLLLVEAVRRKPLNPKLEGYINMAGMCFLLMLIFFITGNDVLRLLK